MDQDSKFRYPQHLTQMAKVFRCVNNIDFAREEQFNKILN